MLGLDFIIRAFFKKIHSFGLEEHIYTTQEFLETVKEYLIGKMTE